MPRDSYSTETRLKIQQVLQERLEASDCEFSTYFSESVLTGCSSFCAWTPAERCRSIRRVSSRKCCRPAVRQDDYQGLVVERFGEAKGTHLLSQFPKGFPAGYRERFSPQSATVDMQHVLDLSEERPLVMSFYQPITAEENRLHCKLYHLDTPLPLSDILPIMENLGLRVLGEFPFQLRDSSGRDYWIHDFAFTYSEGLEIDLLEINEALQDAFIPHLWRFRRERCLQPLGPDGGPRTAGGRAAAGLCALSQADPHGLRSGLYRQRAAQPHRHRA